MSISDFFSDLRHSFRTLSFASGFTLAAIFSLALGIGANVAMFSLVNGVLLKPLAYPDADRLLFISTRIPKVANLYPTVPVSAVHLARWQEEMKTLESAAAYNSTTLNITGKGEPERLGTTAVTWQFFDVLRIKPQLGRFFTADDGVRGRPKVVIISDSFWRRRFNADPAIIGSKILLDDTPYDVIAVTPRDFSIPSGNQLHQLAQLPEKTDLLIPIRFSASDLHNDEMNFNYGVFARLKKGATIDQARAEIEVIMAALSKEGKELLEMHASLESLQSTLVGDARKGLLILLGAVGFVLLIVCVNVANLTLVRGTARRREFAIRAALGAVRSRLIVHCFAESLLLSAAGGALGLLVAAWIIDLVVSRSQLRLPRLDETTIDGNVLAFTAALGVLTAFLFGLLPALRAAGVSPQESLQSGSRGNTEGPRGGRLRSWLVGLQVALSTVLLISAGLMLSSFLKLINVNRGFEIENVVSVDLSLPGPKYGDNKNLRRQFFQRVQTSVKALPGVTHAGLINNLPLTGQSDVSAVITEGSGDIPTMERPISTYRRVSPAYFPAIGIPLRAGRIFEEDEKELVTVIGENVARKLWPGQNPLGRRLQRYGETGEKRWFKVVGIVGDVRSARLDKAPDSMIYQPYWQRGGTDMTLVVRTAMDPAAIAAAIRDQVHQADPDVPVPAMVPLERIVSASVAQRKFQAILIAAFAFVALILACIGIYGVVAYAVMQRRAEIGVRLAIGATPRQVSTMILRLGMLPVLSGLSAGILAALASSRLLSSLLFEVKAVDPVTYVGVPALLAIVAAAACYIPARRAARIDPIQALRYE